MEALFRNLIESKGKNTVDGLMGILNKAKLADTQAQQQKIKTMLNNASSQGKVEYKKFQEIVMSCASEKNISAEQATKQLTEAASTDASNAANSAADGAISKVKDVIGGLFARK